METVRVMDDQCDGFQSDHLSTVFFFVDKEALIFLNYLVQWKYAFGWYNHNVSRTYDNFRK